MERNILITGGLGFIGSNLTSKCLGEGKNVRILSRSDKKIRNINGLEKKIDLIIKDVRNISKEDVEGIDIVYHLASTVNDSEDPHFDIDMNCHGTIAILEALKNYNSKARLVYSSTFFVNGNLEDLPATPGSPTNPSGTYSITKLAAENFCKTYNEIFEMNTVIARLTNLFGPKDQRGAFNKMIKSIYLGEEKINLYNNGEMKRDYLYIDDVIDGLKTIAEKGKTDEVYYISRGEGIKMRSMVDLLLEEVGRGEEMIVKSDIPKFYQAKKIGDFWCDNSKLKKLGWEPKVSLRQGIKRTIDWYKKESEEDERK